ncbi:helix-turn-helix transcriptional regulator [Polaromonas jejuensis]|uniref:Helix-turn-helix transcriptional regulator n=1 Tax=Polaromonas jejuensis TaxID=457502 RepID=A0ABW0QBZ0_9BURK|nr:helix-turn-helix transcriptional regulator [Polaromonas jejuensis]
MQQQRSRGTTRSVEEFSRLTHLIYEAAAEPQKWSEVVGALADSLNASKGLLFTPYVGPQEGGMVFPWKIAEQQLQLWATHYIGHDIWSEQAMQRGLLIEGTTVVDEEMVSRETLRESIFYREFLSTMGIGRVCVGVVFEGAPGLPATSLSVFRDFHEPAFSAADKAWLQLLVPHLSRALGLMHRLNAARLKEASLLSALDRLAFGVALLNERTEVLHLNLAAQDVLGRGDGLVLNALKQLEAPGSHTNSASLPHWLASIAALDATDPTHFSESLLLPRSDGVNSYALQCSALPVSDAWQAEGEAVRFVVFITDPAAVQLPDTARLRKLYGFTETQARVARHLAGGASYKQVASELNMAEETVRAHIKEIYPKARVNRQSHLVRMIMSLGQVAV